MMQILDLVILNVFFFQYMMFCDVFMYLFFNKAGQGPLYMDTVTISKCSIHRLMYRLMHAARIQASNQSSGFL